MVFCTMNTFHCVHVVFILSFFAYAIAWKRYETRVLNCSNTNGTLCILELPKGQMKTVGCRQEVIPDSERTKLNNKATHRLACPVGCTIHIVQKADALNRNCLSYSTFGKYYDVITNNWYIWFCEPCEGVFKTNCEFDE